MKKIILVLSASVCLIQTWGQGTLQITPGANIKSSGGAYLVLDNMHIINNGSFQQAAGNGSVKLTGSLDVNLSGSSPTILNQLLLAKGGSSTLNLQSNLSVVSGVNFSGGLLNLNNNVLNLGTTGSFFDESETSRALTTGSGYVQRTGVLNMPSSINLGNLGAMITSNVNMGSMIIRRGHAVQSGVVGSNNSIKRYFDIIPAINQNLKATLHFFYFDAELNSIPEASLHQYKSNNNVNWDFVGANSRSTSSNYVEKISINKFERFTLATATAPALTCPANITTNANLSGCKATVSFAASATGIPTPTIIYRIGNTVITSPHVFSKGTTTVSVTASNGVLPNSTCSFTVTVLCGNAMSKTVMPEKHNELKTEFLLTARPNPTNHYFTLDLKSNDALLFSIRIVDIHGRTIETRSKLTPNSVLSVGHNYSPGIYFVEAVQGKEKRVLKLIKQN